MTLVELGETLQSAGGVGGSNAKDRLGMCLTASENGLGMCLMPQLFVVLNISNLM